MSRESVVPAPARCVVCLLLPPLLRVKCDAILLTCLIVSSLRQTLFLVYPKVSSTVLNMYVHCCFEDRPLQFELCRDDGCVASLCRTRRSLLPLTLATQVRVPQDRVDVVPAHGLQHPVSHQALVAVVRLLACAPTPAIAFCRGVHVAPYLVVSCRARCVNSGSILHVFSPRRCFDDRWTKYIPYDAAMILVYPIGIPLGFFYLLMK
jgi:hypothetical protein